MKALKNIEDKISQLSPDMLDELNQYLDYLIHKKSIQKQGKLKLDWAGGLKDIKLTALELQKKALEWRLK